MSETYDDLTSAMQGMPLGKVSARTGVGLEAYAPSVHVTADGSIGINVGGVVHVKPLRAWHALAEAEWPPEIPENKVVRTR